MSRAANLPNIPAVTDANVSDAVRAIKGILDVREGKVGDVLDANVTFRDLIDAGAVTLSPSWGVNNGAPPIMPFLAKPDGYDPTTDYTQPPKPLAFVATGGFANVILQWDEAAYRNHAYTEIWRSDTNVIGNAQLLGTTDSFIYPDPLGAGGSKYYWIRFVSKANVTGPFNDTNGTLGTTSLDPAVLMAALASTYGDAPFIEIPTDVTIDGVFIPAGVYMKSAYIINAAITTAKIKDLAVDTAKIANAAIATAKIADAAITTAKISNANITTAKIADASITTGKIALAAITEALIYDAAITTAKIADAAITNAKITSLDATKITTGYLSAARIAANTITASMIDSRGLTIMDSGGTVLFGSGTPLDWSLLSGQPSGIYNSNVYIDASGSLHNAGGGSVSLSGLGAGAFAWLGQINSGNVSTYIDSAAIGTAYIGDAAIVNAKIGNAEVDTLKVAGNAIGFSGGMSGHSGSVSIYCPDGGSISCICFTGGNTDIYNGEFVLVIDGGTPIGGFMAPGVSDGSGGWIYGPATQVWQGYFSAGWHTVGFYQNNIAYATPQLLWFFSMR